MLYLRAIAALVRDLYDRAPPADPALWHRFTPVFPKRGIDGQWVAMQGGTIWRRRCVGRWEYRQDPETSDAWADRQW